MRRRRPGKRQGIAMEDHMGKTGKIIAKCGLVCSDCGAYIATAANSDELRKKTAKEWSELYGGNVEWKTVNCLGCMETRKEMLFSHCLVCGIRTCALAKGFATCADCPDFGCDKVNEIWKHVPDARANLQSLKA
jgi:hypothetical protein